MERAHDTNNSLVQERFPKSQKLLLVEMRLAFPCYCMFPKVREGWPRYVAVATVAVVVITVNP
eukprot:6463972-Amphidinium_carterae.1